MDRVIPFADRSRNGQVALVLIVPLLFGAVVGVALGVSAALYWALGILAGIGALLAGLEHPGWRGGALRGLVGGAVYGIGLLLAHEVSGAEEKVSLGEFPPALILITALLGSALGALGARVGAGRGVHRAAAEPE
jgi:hypothetical protein